MALTVNPDTCIGCGVCVSMVENVFEMDDSRGVAVVKDENGAPREEIQEAIAACPVEAIAF